MSPPRPSSEAYNEWVHREEAAKAKVALLEKRAANIAAKDASSPVKMSYAQKAPKGFQKVIEEKRAAQHVYTEDEQRTIHRANMRRTFALEARRVFGLADSDKTLALDYAEIKECVSNADLAEYMIQRFDSDGDGYVSLQEWLHYIVDLTWENSPRGAWHVLRAVERQMAERTAAAREAKAKELLLADASKMFTAYDTDQSGGLIASEIAGMLEGNEGLSTAVKNETALMFLAELDADHSGAIELNEWLAFVEALFNADRDRAHLFVRQLEAVLRRQRAKAHLK